MISCGCHFDLPPLKVVPVRLPPGEYPVLWLPCGIWQRLLLESFLRERMNLSLYLGSSYTRKIVTLHDLVDQSSGESIRCHHSDLHDLESKRYNRKWREGFGWSWCGREVFCCQGFEVRGRWDMVHRRILEELRFMGKKAFSRHLEGCLIWIGS